MIPAPQPQAPAYPYTLAYVWRKDDDLHLVVRNNLRACGYPDVSSFAADVRAENPTIVDWEAVAEASVINLPSLAATPRG